MSGKDLNPTTVLVDGEPILLSDLVTERSEAIDREKLQEFKVDQIEQEILKQSVYMEASDSYVVVFSGDLMREIVSRQSPNCPPCQLEKAKVGSDQELG